MKLRKLTDTWGGKGPTAIVEHGANPGLVSHLTKKALFDIGEKIKSGAPISSAETNLVQNWANKNSELVGSINADDVDNALLLENNVVDNKQIRIGRMGEELSNLTSVTPQSNSRASMVRWRSPVGSCIFGSGTSM